jgi:hypothetical protein
MTEPAAADPKDRAAQIEEELAGVVTQLEALRKADKPPATAITQLMKLEIDLRRELNEVLTADTFSNDPTEGMSEEEFKVWLGERAEEMADDHLLVFIETYAARYNVVARWEAA